MKTKKPDTLEAALECARRRLPVGYYVRVLVAVEYEHPIVWLERIGFKPPYLDPDPLNRMTTPQAIRRAVRLAMKEAGL